MFERIFLGANLMAFGFGLNSKYLIMVIADMYIDLLNDFDEFVDITC
jgi:hypothetical protein